MSHRNYMDSGFSSPTKQRNIIAFVGNGFDIQVMKDYGSSIDTRYESFYHFLKLRSFSKDNPIFREMQILLQAGRENWSDVEGVVESLLYEKQVNAAILSGALQEIQAQFTDFLDLAVPSSLLVSLGNDSMENNLAIESLKGFLGDLSVDEYRKTGFPGRCSNFDIYNFVFFNLNYTQLLDNYLYLDQKQFDPLPYKTVDRNFMFQGNPGGVSKALVREDDAFSSYLMTEIVHPHGNQGVPRSLLFGVDTPQKIWGNQDQTLRLAKPFWGQNEHRYSHLFNDTELFILFGCSLGESDRWWWRSIADVLGQSGVYSVGSRSFLPEVIIYWYNGAGSSLTSDEVCLRFLSSAGVEDQYDDLRDYIHVVLYDSSSNRLWLNTSRE